MATIVHINYSNSFLRGRYCIMTIQYLVFKHRILLYRVVVKENYKFFPQAMVKK